MTATLVAHGLAGGYGHRTLFEGLELTVAPGDVVGVVGANGAGKSTFLKAISGELEATKGSVTLGPGERLSVLSQDHFKWDQYTVLNTVLMGHTVLWDIMNQRDALYAKPDFSDEDGLKVAELEERFAELEGWNAESDAAALLSGLGIKEDKHYLLMSELSGKEKVRVMLAQALFGNPDNLLLDEPTNDIDVNTLRALEEGLENFAGCAVVISHDRWFLDRVATHILSFEDEGKVVFFEGTYSEYEEHKKAQGIDTTPHRVKYRKLIEN